MLGHLTPNNCQHQFGQRYRALMERFQHIVRFGLQGHTHRESFQVTKSISDNTKSIGINSIAGSVSPFTEMNPSFMVLTLDAATMLPVAMETYSMNIDRANADGKPTWELLHDYQKEYGMTDLSPNSFMKLAEQIKVDQDMANQFKWNEIRRKGPKPTNTDKLALYCDLASTESWEKDYCLGKNPGDFLHNTAEAIVDYIVGDWINIE